MARWFCLACFFALLLACGTGPVAPPAPPRDGGSDPRDGEPSDGQDGAPEDGAPEDGGFQDDGDGGELDAGGDVPPEPPRTNVPPQGSARTLDLGSWNIEWFGDPDEGPRDDAQQAENAYQVLLGCAMDIWGVVEIVDEQAFAALVSRMPGYRGVLARDVPGGSAYSTGEQKVGFVYREAIATLRSASVVLGSDASAFGGRPPLEGRFEVTIGARTAELVVLVLHAKAFDDFASWQRRSEAAQLLKDYLDRTYTDEQVIVLGDFNDTLDGSITSGRASPYAALVADSARYFFPTAEVDNGTTVGRDTVIDHHMITTPLRAHYIAGSADAFRADRYVPNYATTTSNHYPVLSRYTW